MQDFRLEVDGVFDEGIVGILGETGCGKTTLLKCLLGIIKPDSGEITIANFQAFSSQKKISLSIQERNVGMVFQDALLFPHMTVRKNILFGAKKGIKKRYFNEVVDILKLYKLFKRSPLTLSGGERQRVALGRTLIHQPSVLLMDEPISAIDINTRHQIISYLKDIQRNFNIPVVYVSHSISELLYLTDNVYVMEHGRNIEYGSSQRILMHRSIIQSVKNEDIENLFELSVKQIFREEKRALLDFGGNDLQVIYSSEAIQPRLRVGIRANDIIIARNKVAGISARNMIPATIKSFMALENKYLINLDVNGLNCMVEITWKSFQELGLDSGQNVFLIIKSRACVLLD